MKKDEKAKDLIDELLKTLTFTQQQPTNEVLSDILLRLDEINSRIEKIENKVEEKLISGKNFSTGLHPSQQKIEIPEIVEVFLPGTKIKACTFEPNGKPCDNCALCNTRGF